MRGFLLALAWLATVAAAFVIGKTLGAGEAPPEPERAVVRDADASAATDPGPMLAPGASADVLDAPSAAARDKDAGSSAGTAGDLRAAEVAGETVGPFTLEGVTDPDVAMSRIMLHVAALLAKGEDGHLELLAFLDEQIVRNKDLERIFEGSDEQMARYIVPMIEFMVHRKSEVLGVIETVFETMAERPQALAEFDDDTLEIFTEGAAVILPGAVDEQELAKYRGWAHKLLETPEGSLPEPVEKQRRRLKQALMLWAPRLSDADALARLRAGTLQGSEAVQVLRGIPPEQLADLDLGQILEPVVAQLDFRTLRALENIPLQPRDVDLLDRTVLEAAGAGKAREWMIVQYLHATRRGTWPAQQTFLEEGFRRGGATLEACALSLARLGRQVPPDYIRWALDTYELSENAARRLESSANRK